MALRENSFNIIIFHLSYEFDQFAVAFYSLYFYVRLTVMQIRTKSSDKEV